MTDWFSPSDDVAACLHACVAHVFGGMVEGAKHVLYCIVQYLVGKGTVLR